MEKQDTKKNIPICEKCKKPMEYNLLSEEYECSNPLCYLKEIPSSLWQDLNNPIYHEIYTTSFPQTKGVVSLFVKKLIKKVKK